MPCHVFLYTTAPEGRDLPGTHTVYAPVGATTQGDLVRIVAVPLLDCSRNGGVIRGEGI